MGNVETVLASSIVAVAWAAGVVSGTMWFGSVTTPVQCFGPTRYAWDLGLYLSASESLVQRSCSSRPAECIDGWREVLNGLAFDDYLGGQGRGSSRRLGLPRSERCQFGTSLHSYGLSGRESIVRDGYRPTTLPTAYAFVLLDDRSVVRADQPFRR